MCHHEPSYLLPASPAEVKHLVSGVAYDDLDEDGFYTPDAGEALEDVSVEVFGTPGLGVTVLIRIREVGGRIERHCGLAWPGLGFAPSERRLLAEAM